MRFIWQHASWPRWTLSRHRQARQRAIGSQKRVLQSCAGIAWYKNPWLGKNRKKSAKNIAITTISRQDPSTTTSAFQSGKKCRPDLAITFARRRPARDREIEVEVRVPRVHVSEHCASLVWDDAPAVFAEIETHRPNKHVGKEAYSTWLSLGTDRRHLVACMSNHPLFDHSSDQDPRWQRGMIELSVPNNTRDWCHAWVVTDFVTGRSSCVCVCCFLSFCLMSKFGVVSDFVFGVIASVSFICVVICWSNACLLCGRGACCSVCCRRECAVLILNLPYLYLAGAGRDIERRSFFFCMFVCIEIATVLNLQEK